MCCHKHLCLIWFVTSYQQIFNEGTLWYISSSLMLCLTLNYLSYPNLLIYWMLFWVLTYLYTLQVCNIYLTMFKEFKYFWPFSFTYPSVKGIDNFWKVRVIIGRFNESCRQIASEEKWQMSQWVLYYFLTPLNYIYRTTHIFLGIRRHCGRRWRMWIFLGWGLCYT